MRKTILIAMLLNFCFMTGALADSKSLNLNECKLPPKIDGKLDDTCWKNAFKTDELWIFKSDEKTKDTIFRLCRDNTWFYIGIKCLNEGMKHLEQTAFEPSSYVVKDDSVEIFIDPGTNGKKSRQFMLNFANVKHEKTFGLKGTSVNEGWSCPWRSATKILPNGWEAEIAIPLFALADGDLGKMKINLLRNKNVPEIDNLGAKQGERREHQVLVQGSVKNAAAYIPVKGLENVKVAVPFAPVIKNVELGTFRKKGDRYCFPVTVTVSPETEISGSCDVFIIDTQIGVSKEHKAGKFAVDNTEKITVEIPLDNFKNRELTAVIKDESGSLLSSAKIANVDSLSIVKDVFIGRNYYTSEENADIKTIFNMSDEMLQNVKLRIITNAKTLYEKTNPPPVFIASIPLSKLHIGDTPVQIEILLNDNAVYSKNLNIRKLKPRPGHEVKADLIRKTMLRNGKPFFPIGIMVHHIRKEKHFKFLSDLGFNTIQPSISYLGKYSYQNKPDDLPRIMDLADKYNLQVILWGAINRVFGGYYQQFPLNTVRGNFEKMVPPISKSIDHVKNRKNMFMYFNVDEPNLWNQKISVKVLEWYGREIQKHDPYHPLFINFSKQVPAGDAWTDWGVAISDDIYIRPWTGTGLLSEPGIGNAYYSYKIQQRCEKDHKIMFMVPLAAQHSIAKGPVGNSNQEMLCQNYSSLIYGAKGIIFFCFTTVANYDSWNGIKTICQQIKALSPALLNHEVKQNISYPGQTNKPLSATLPQVVARTFKYPNGDYVVLAANLRHYAADVKFVFPGTQSVVREFGKKQTLTVNQGIFEEKMEPYGTRAYRIKSVIKEPVNLSVTSIPDKTILAPSIDVPAIARQMRTRKNYWPNPCFEQQLIKGTPDFYKPYFNFPSQLIYDVGKKGSLWFVDQETTWNGKPALCMDRTPGKDTPSGTFAVCYPPALDKPTKMVFSFYAKGAKNDDGLIVNLFGLAKERIAFKLSDQWQRFSIPATVNPSSTRNNGARDVIFLTGLGSKVWISGIQLEMGTEPTDFQDDSAPKKKR